MLPPFLLERQALQRRQPKATKVGPGRWLPSCLASLCALLCACVSSPGEPPASPAKPVDTAVPSTSIDLDAPYVLLLGTAQDGGLPQLGCRLPCCEAARAEPDLLRLVPSLLIVDPSSAQRWLVDATPDLAERLAEVDIALLDGRFFADGEIPGRSLADIPHPFITETLALLAAMDSPPRARVVFTHLNHTNPATRPGSAARRAVEAAGASVASEGQVWTEFTRRSRVV